MRGLIFYLVTFGCIDGHLSPEEMDFIHQVVRQVVEYRVDHPPEGAEEGDRQEQLDLYMGYFDEMIEVVTDEVSELMTEAVAEAESRQKFVTSQLKQRCFELFQTFDPEQQQTLLSAVNGLLWSDGEAHPAELELRHGLTALLEEEIEDAEERIPYPRDISLKELPALPHVPATQPWFDGLERRLPEKGDPEVSDELERDQMAVHAAQMILHQHARYGTGRLAEHIRVVDLADQSPFMDGTVCWFPPRAGRRYEVTVLGDLHGCYSCFKGALQQSEFLTKLEAFRVDPCNEPEPLLVLLGDYLDRGKYGFQGVLRAALRLMALAPNHVVVLRGNHEDFFENDVGDRIDSTVRPAESIEEFREIAPLVLLRNYKSLFKVMPHALLFGRILFTHAGIPADGVVETADRTLASLNDPLTAFQMRWSDPSMADVIPRKLQSESYRFGYGRLQAQAFLQRHGCHTMIRGHEKIEDGFERKIEDAHVQVMTLFSAGGESNTDLPEKSSYRRVRPMAMTIRHEGDLDGRSEFEVWPIDYAPYNDGKYNKFYADPEIEPEPGAVEDALADVLAETRGSMKTDDA